MIGADQVHSSCENLLPQRLTRLGIAYRRRAFQRRADALEVRFGESEIVRARLRGDRYALAPRRIHLRQSRGAAYVDDVRAHALTGAAHADEQPADRIDLGAGRPGATPREWVGRSLGGEHLLAFSVYAHDRVQARSHLESDREHTVGHAGKVVNAAVTQEGFEPYHAPVVEVLEVLKVVGDKTTPKPKVHERLPRGASELRVKRRDGGRGRMGVERHLEARGVDDLFGVAHFAPDGTDDSAGNGDIGWALSRGKDGGSAPDHEVGRSHTSSIVMSCAPSQSVSLPISGSCSWPCVSVAK